MLILSESLSTVWLKKPPEGGLCKVLSFSLSTSITEYQGECNTLSCGVLPRFGDLLIALIKKQGSVRKFAEKADVSDSVFWMIKSGEMVPPPERVEQWARLLHLTGRELDEFLDSAAVAMAPDWASDQLGKLVQRLEKRIAEREQAYDALEKKVDRLMGGDPPTKR